jgi:tetratricopeptide (TPR) repeat protein
MSYRVFSRAAVVLVCVAGLVMGQGKKKDDPKGQPAPAAVPAGSPVARQPQVKSQAELQAVQAMLGAQDPDTRIKAANDLVAKFADSEFKGLALFFAAASYQQKGDADQMMVYLERTIEADPGNYQALLMLAGAIANRTKEFDLDREEKLKAAEGYANKALELLKTAPRPNSQITDEQWEIAKRDLGSQAHEAFGLAAYARNQPDKAVEEFKLAIASAAQPDPSTQVRLAAAYSKGSKYDDAIAVLNKVLADASLNPAIKKIAEAERMRAVQLKEKGADAAKK